MKKKLFSLIMAVAMVASLAIPALASDNSQNISGKGSKPGTVNLAGNMALPSVNVTMPKTGATILNPYKMKVKKSATFTDGAPDVDSTATNNTDDQVLSARHLIVNKTEAALNVGIAVTATPANDSIVLTTAACTGKETTKSVFMFIEAQYIAANATTPADTVLYGLTWTAPGKVNAKCYPQIVAGTEEASNPNFFVLPAASSTTPNYLAWTISGNTALSPDGGWAEADKVTTAVTFTFTPTVVVEVKEADDTTPGVATIEVGNPNEATANALKTAMTNSSKLYLPMGAVVRVEAVEGATLSGVEVKDSETGTKVTATKVNAGLYYFAVPANGATVKISGTAPNP